MILKGLIDNLTESKEHKLSGYLAIGLLLLGLYLLELFLPISNAKEKIIPLLARVILFLSLTILGLISALRINLRHHKKEIEGLNAQLVSNRIHHQKEIKALKNEEAIAARNQKLADELNSEYEESY